MKTRHHWIFLILTLGLAFLLAACGEQTSPSPESASAAEIKPTIVIEAQQDIESLPNSLPSPWVEDVTRIDKQGSVEIKIVPLNPNNPEHTLDFNVRLNTHSVDLSMDLAILAIIETDAGLTVQATTWDAPRGGHHVTGILSFPGSVEGTPLLEGVTKMTLTITDVDAPERVFVWER